MFTFKYKLIKCNFPLAYIFTLSLRYHAINIFLNYIIIEYTKKRKKNLTVSIKYVEIKKTNCFKLFFIQLRE